MCSKYLKSSPIFMKQCRGGGPEHFPTQKYNLELPSLLAAPMITQAFQMMFHWSDSSHFVCIERINLINYLYYKSDLIFLNFIMFDNVLNRFI